MERDLGSPRLRFRCRRRIRGRRRRKFEQHTRAPERHGVFWGLEIDGRSDVTYRRKIFGGEEERVRELVFVGKDDTGEGEMGMEGAGL